jgi:hypothetical protein
MNNQNAKEARESREMTRMETSYKNRQAGSARDIRFVFNRLISFAFICAIRGQLPDLG